jgi:hypothetical protein
MEISAGALSSTAEDSGDIETGIACALTREGAQNMPNPNSTLKCFARMLMRKVYTMTAISAGTGDAARDSGPRLDQSLFCNSYRVLDRDTITHQVAVVVRVKRYANLMRTRGGEKREREVVPVAVDSRDLYSVDVEMRVAFVLGDCTAYVFWRKSEVLRRYLEIPSSHGVGVRLD